VAKQERRIKRNLINDGIGWDQYSNNLLDRDDDQYGDSEPSINIPKEVLVDQSGNLTSMLIPSRLTLSWVVAKLPDIN